MATATGDALLLGSWQNFYILFGTAAATLTGLMFVATSLLVGSDTHAATLNAGVSAFSTPTVMHFCSVLLMAGILSAPWPALSIVRLLLGLLGLAMVIYLLIVLRQMRQVPHYRTPLRDWLWYMAFPLAIYGALVVAMMPLRADIVLYLVGAAMVLLLLLGIRNAWDLVTFLAIQRSSSRGETQNRQAGDEP